MATSYAKMPGKLKSLTPFEGNSASAMIEDGEYRIYSYATLIAIVDMKTKKVVYFNERKFSQTTSRLQGMIKRVY